MVIDSPLQRRFGCHRPPLQGDDFIVGYGRFAIHSSCSELRREFVSANGVEWLHGFVVSRVVCCWNRELDNWKRVVVGASHEV